MVGDATLPLGCIAAVAVAALLWPTFGSPAQAQSTCKSFGAIVHATLPTSTPLALDDTWGGPLYAILGASLNVGILSGNDGSEIWRGHLGNMGQGRDGVYTVGFGCTTGSGTYPTGAPLLSCTDSFTYQVPHAVFPGPPGQVD
jgi:hypothetical protein